MILQLFIGTIMIALTVVIHAVVLDLIMKKTPFFEKIVMKMKRLKPFRKAAVIAVIVLCVFAAHVTDMWLWAIFYLSVGSLPDLETALYFSTASFTTLGYGDIVLTENWRLLSSIEGANGMIIFGWSTAFIFEVISNLYRKEGQALKP